MSYDIVKEDVPMFVRRIGDCVIGGSNNSIIVLGTDRVDSIESGYGHIDASNDGKGAGSIHMIVGRSSEDFDMDLDKSFICLSMRTDVDLNLDLSSIEENVNDTPAAIIKSDSVRIVARNDLKISLGGAYMFMKSDGTIVLDGPNIRLGSQAAERIIKGEVFTALYNSHIHPTAVGPTGPTANPIIPEAHLSSRKVFVA